MEDLKIAFRIAEKRKEKGITQEELAKHLGVSKPAVSKWESGQSYPDILLLPMIASYFNISVDELIGYEPQMTEDEIRNLNRSLSAAFKKEPFEQVYSQCEGYLKKYYSCTRLQFQMGLLLLQYSSLAGSSDRSREILSEVLKLFQRIEKTSEDVNLAKHSVQMQALCYLSLQQPEEVVRLMENFNSSIMPAETLLVKAYQMMGNMDKSMETLQGYTYVNLMKLFSTAPDFFHMYEKEPERMELYYRIFKGLSELFDVINLHPAGLMNAYISAALTFARQSKKEKAFDALEVCVDLMDRVNKEHHLFYKENSVFDKLGCYFTDSGPETEAVENYAEIVKNYKNIIISNPVFDNLREEERYKHIKLKLGMV